MADADKLDCGKSFSPSKVAGALGPISLVALTAAFLWWKLFDHLRIEWSNNSQYAHCWAVPFLCGYLVYHRWQLGVPARLARPGCWSSALIKWGVTIATAAALLCYFPVRLVQEANPEWRLVSWSLAAIVICITLGLFRVARAWFEVSPGFLATADLAFPLFFSLVAVPWPSFIEQPIVQHLTFANTALTVDLLDLFGVPAFRRGNLVEVATGLVGVDQACSGIRSFQATLMISLFLGEIYSLSVARRLLCVVAGFGFSFVFNIGRTTLLSWVAAKSGTGAVAAWHDPAGATILVGCFAALWALCAWLRRGAQTTLQSGKAASEPNKGRELPRSRWFLILGIGCWLGLSEIGVHLWYRFHESQLPPAVTWTVKIPEGKENLIRQPLAPATLSLLKADDWKQFSWTEGQLNWHVVYLEWKAGRVAGYLSKVHNPQTCLPAAGFSILSMGPPEKMEVSGLTLGFRRYIFRNERLTRRVWYFLWDDRRYGDVILSEAGSAWGDRLRTVMNGKGDSGQRLLEIAVEGADDEPALGTAIQKLLTILISRTYACP